MKKDIHHTDGEESDESKNMNPRESRQEEEKESHEESSSDNPPLDELLDIPALGDIPSIFFLYLFS